MTALDEARPAPEERLPFHLRGNYAPVMDEIEAFDLPVIGALPRQLNGRYVRNGANPKSGRSGHWFGGDGMLHGIRLRDGAAEWYRNRWVRTKALDGAKRIDMKTGARDLTVGLANTHVVRHAGRIMALEEGSLPNLISPDLDTLGPDDFAGRLRTPFTAHPHTCAETGEMHFFGYDRLAPYVTYHVVDAQGNLVHSQPIEVGGPTMMHDFAISRNYAIFMDLPVVFDLEMAMKGTMPFQWSDDYPPRIGLLHRERARHGEQPRWFDIDPCYVFHIMNAWESADGAVVHLDAGRHASMWRGDSDAFEPCYLHRWSFDLSSGAVHEQQLDDLTHDFPRIDDRRTGLPIRYGYAVGPRPDDGKGMTTATNIVKYDLHSGERTLHDFGPTSMTGEPVFVPAGDHDARNDHHGEDEGYLVTFVYDKATNSSRFVVLDATGISAAPIAQVPLPQRVPHGFHGSWFADE